MGFYCVHSAKLELFPRIPLPVWIQARAEQKENLQAVWKTEVEQSSGHYTLRLAVVRHRKKQKQGCPQSPSGLCPPVLRLAFCSQLLALLTNRDSKPTTRCRGDSLPQMSPPAVLGGSTEQLDRSCFPLPGPSSPPALNFSRAGQ